MERPPVAQELAQGFHQIPHVVLGATLVLRGLNVDQSWTFLGF